MNKMKKRSYSERQNRTRMLIQVGGLVQKSGLLEVFTIQTGEDLQDYESLHKAAQLLGFLSEVFEKIDASEQKLLNWQHTGERLSWPKK